MKGKCPGDVQLVLDNQGRTMGRENFLLSSYQMISQQKLYKPEGNGMTYLK